MDSNFSVTPEPKPAREIFKSWNFWKPFLGVTVGGTGGFLYYYFIGCNSGTCPITGTPYGSILMGGLLGYLILSSIGTSNRKEKK
jgi:hypothetical protein